MRLKFVQVLAALALTIQMGMGQAAASGEFRGVIAASHFVKPSEKWIFVQGRNGLLRKVNITRARVVYDDAVPVDQRRERPSYSLIEGAEVRVNAKQDADGEWNALQIVIMKMASSVEREGARKI